MNFLDRLLRRRTPCESSPPPDRRHNSELRRQIDELPDQELRIQLLDTYRRLMEGTDNGERSPH